MVKSNLDKTNRKKQDNMEDNKKGNSGIWQDERFQHLLEDPRFRGVPKQHRKVKIDKRFQSMFTDDKFKVKYTVDKYGRRINKSNSEDLRKYYELNSSEDDEDADDDIETKGKATKETTESNEKDTTIKSRANADDRDGESGMKTKKQLKNKEPVADSSDDDDEAEERRAEELAITADAKTDQTQNENDTLSSDGETVPKSIRERLLDPSIDYARGEGRLVTDSSSDDDSSDDDEDDIPELQIDHVWGELDNDAETTDESTHRLAVCNMDWDRIRAQDIMILLNSFLPPGGSVLSVKIYPSEFGKARMAEEEIHGPTELVASGAKEGDNDDLNNDDTDDDEDSIENGREQDSDAEEGDDYHMEKLRKYQLNRLRYYYAVVECDNVTTADKLYKECDGIEYESSATRVDLRFIPDDTTFDDDEPTDECRELPDMSIYKPRQFTTTALQQAKVDLTWDETALERRELGDKLSSGKLDQISDKDLRQIVAYSSEEEEDVEKEDSQEVKENNNANETNESTKLEKRQEPKQPQEADSKAQKKVTKKQRLKESISKYQALLTEINEKEKQKKKLKNYEMEMTWDIATENANNDAEVETKSKTDLTPIEKVLQKRSEKNKKRKEERQLKKLQAKGIDPNEVNESDDDMLPDGIDLNDPYFAEEFADGDFIEPKSKKKTKQKKQRATDDNDDEETARNEKELELLLEDEEDNTKQHFSLDKILKSEQDSSTSKRKRRKQLKKAKSTSEVVEDSFEVNVTDPRFRAVYSAHEFNIDPTDPHFKKTKGMEQIIQEKLKRRQEQKSTDNKNAYLESTAAPAKRSKKELEDSILVKSLKRKIQMKMQNKR